MSKSKKDVKRKQQPKKPAFIRGERVIESRKALTWAYGGGDPVQMGVIYEVERVNKYRPRFHLWLGTTTVVSSNNLSELQLILSLLGSLVEKKK
jgi:hypothetical protein